MIRAPSRGEALRASWGAAVADGVNALAPMAAPGALARQGVTGFGAQPLPQNRRERRASAAEDSPDAFRVRARVETRTQGDATEKRLVVEMFSTDQPMVTWNAFDIKGSVEDVEGLSPAEGVSFETTAGWQTIHEGEWEGEDGFAGDLDVWLKLKILAEVLTNSSYDLKGEATHWTLCAEKGDDEKCTYAKSDDTSSNTVGTRELIRYMLLAEIKGGKVTCQGILGTLHFVELFPDRVDSGGSGLTDDAIEALRRNSAFGLATEKDEEGNVTGRTVVNLVWRVGGRTRRQSGSVSVGTGDGVFCAKFSGDAFASCEIVSTTWDGLSTLESDEESYVVPLYEISEGTVVDLRTAPQVQAFEEALS